MTTPRRIARRPGPVVRVGQRRRTAWDDLVLGTNLDSASTNSFLLMGNVADPEKRGCTVVRIIVHMWYVAATPGTTNSLTSIDVGIALVSDDAFSANALPEIGVADDFPVGGWYPRLVHIRPP